MASKQGGKGKSSSPSSIAYWKRVSPDAQKAKRIAKHCRRMGLTMAQLANRNGLPTVANYPRQHIPAPAQFAVFSRPVDAAGCAKPGENPRLVICEGVAIWAGGRDGAAASVLGEIAPGLAFRSVEVGPDGVQRTRSARPVGGFPRLRPTPAA